MKTLFERARIEAPGDALARPHANCYWLVPARVLAGEYPASDDERVMAQQMRALLDAGITHCFDLTHLSEALPAYADTFSQAAAARGVAVVTQRFSVADFGVPSVAGMRLTLAAIDTALAAGGNVYIHCHGGIGRTGTVVGCLLREQGLDTDAALGLIGRKWQVMTKRLAAPRSPETAEQRAFIKAWHGP